MTLTIAYRPVGWLAAVLFALAGCGASKEEATRFNNTLAESDKRFVEASKEFIRAANAAAGGGVMEVALVKRAYENVVDAAARMRADSKTLKVPKSKTAQAFYDAHMAMMVQREELVKEDFRIVMKVLEDPLLTPQERQRKLQPSARYLNNLDHGAERQVKIAQAAFVSEFSLQIKK